MLFSIASGWELFWFDVIVYAVLQILRIFIDYILPKRWFTTDRPWFATYKWEDGGKFYEKYFRVNCWKDFLPAVNSLNNFDKRHLKSLDAEYLEQFVFETRLGESHHVRSIVETLFFALWNPPGLFLLVFTLSFLIQAPFIIIQRYNRPRLLRLIEINKKRVGRNAAAAVEATPVSNLEI